MNGTKTSTIWERIGGARAILMIAITFAGIVATAGVLSYRMDRVECDLKELETDYKVFSHDVLTTMQNIDRIVIRIETRQERLIEDIKEMRK